MRMEHVALSKLPLCAERCGERETVRERPLVWHGVQLPSAAVPEIESQNWPPPFRLSSDFSVVRFYRYVDVGESHHIRIPFSIMGKNGAIVGHPLSIVAIKAVISSFSKL